MLLHLWLSKKETPFLNHIIIVAEETRALSRPMLTIGFRFTPALLEASFMCCTNQTDERGYSLLCVHLMWLVRRRRKKCKQNVKKFIVIMHFINKLEIYDTV